MEKIKDRKEDLDVSPPEIVKKKDKVILIRSRRKKNAKDRRDKVTNALLQELANLVPGCSQPSEKLDEAIILKNTIDFIRDHNDSTAVDTISCFPNEIGQLVFKGYHAFLFVISLSGKFTFLSESIYNLLGYTKGNLIETSIYDYIYPEDKINLTRQLIKHSRTGNTKGSGSSSFYIRFKTQLDEKPFYQTLCCYGYFCAINKDRPNNDKDTGRKKSLNKTCFVVLAKPTELNHLRDVSSWLNTDLELEFTSRQNIDGKFVYLDERCILITGYIPHEILGSILHEFIHFDDLEDIMTSFETLLEEGKAETGHYRFLTKGSQWILIKTKSYISYNQWNYKPEFICSTHELVSFRSNADTGSGEPTETEPMYTLKMA